jgi:hypothetical protein
VPKHLQGVAAVLLALAALVAGCGDDKPSKKEYIAKLDNVCQKSNQKIQKVESPQTVKGIGGFTRKVRPILEESIKDAEDLELPDDQGDEFEDYVADSKKSLTELDELEKAADANDTPGVRRVFTKITRENKKRDAQAKKLGLKQCGSG